MKLKPGEYSASLAIAGSTAKSSRRVAARGKKFSSCAPAKVSMTMQNSEATLLMYLMRWLSVAAAEQKVRVEL